MPTDIPTTSTSTPSKSRRRKAADFAANAAFGQVLKELARTIAEHLLG